MHENIVAKNQYDEASVLSGVAVVRDLPPLHRRYAVRRGMAALGLRGAPPPIDDLMVAAVPPSPPRMEPRRFLSGESLYRWAVDHLFGDSRFDGIDGYFDFPRAMAAASMAVGPGAQARHQREHEDAVERYHHEKAIFDQWHGMAWPGGSRPSSMTSRSGPPIPPSRPCPMGICRGLLLRWYRKIGPTSGRRDG